MVRRDSFYMLKPGDEAKWKFEHCIRCGFYPCELIGSYELFKTKNPDGDFLSYNSKELENGCPMHRGVYQVDCSDVRYVSDGINDHYKINTTYCNDIQGYRIEEEKDGGRIYDRRLNLCKKRVKEVESKEKKYERWEPSQPVFISAQTGQGKNTFVEDFLIPYVRDLNHDKETRQKVLILSNRIALTQQIKERLAQKAHYNDEGEEDRIYNPYGRWADVMNYQGFLNRVGQLEREQGWKIKKHGEMKQEKEQKYLFVICDEAHFFTSDSIFNPYTDKILKAITRIFNNAIRVYMTATPYECLEHIGRHESAAPENIVPIYNKDDEPNHASPGVLYHFKRDYSYLDIKYYPDFEELHDVIEKSDKENWLIFFDNIDKGKELKEELEEIDSLRGRVYAVHAESKKDENYQKMVSKETINVELKRKKSSKNEEEKDKTVRVLIATSVIDSGVNFRNINNVVISDISRVKCLQMLGRARVDLDKGDRITLYIKMHTPEELSSRINYLKKRQDAYHDFRTAKIDYRGNFKQSFYQKYLLGGRKGFDKPEHWLGTDENDSHKMFINDIAVSLVDTLTLTYEAILKEMQDDRTSELPGQKYLEYQLSWFEEVYDEDNDITLIDKDEGMKKLIEFLERYVENDVYMSKDEQDEDKCEQTNFSKEFTERYDAVFPRRDKNKSQNRAAYGINQINKALKEHNIPYKIASPQVRDKDTKKKKTVWKVVRIDRKSDS